MSLTLWDIPALAPLAAAGAAAGEDVVLFGSVASRAMLWRSIGRENFSLFDIAPHMSDIDLGHSGRSWKSPILRAAIEALVPMARWFRWSIHDRDQMQRFGKYTETNIRIPLREINLGSSRSPAAESQQALESALQGRIELSNSGIFDTSPRAHYDSEASAALIYLDAMLDLIDLGAIGTAENERQILEPVFELIDAGISRLEKLEEPNRDIAMRRLWYLFSRSAARMGPVGIYNLLYSVDGSLWGLVHKLDAAGYPASTLTEMNGNAVLVSNYLLSGGFRLPLKVSPVRNDGCNKLLEERLGRAFRTDVDEHVALAEGNSAISAVTGIEVRRGTSPSATSMPPLAQEFAHIVLPLPGASAPTPAEELTAVAFGHLSDGVELLPQFAVVDTHNVHIAPRTYEKSYAESSRSCTIRMNLTSAVSNYLMIDVILISDTNFASENVL